MLPHANFLELEPRGNFNFHIQLSIGEISMKVSFRTKKQTFTFVFVLKAKHRRKAHNSFTSRTVIFNSQIQFLSQLAGEETDFSAHKITCEV